MEGVIRNTRLPVGTQGVVKPLKADAIYWPRADTVLMQQRSPPGGR